MINGWVWHISYMAEQKNTNAQKTIILVTTNRRHLRNSWNVKVLSGTSAIFLKYHYYFTHIIINIKIIIYTQTNRKTASYDGISSPKPANSVGSNTVANAVDI